MTAKKHRQVRFAVNLSLSVLFRCVLKEKKDYVDAGIRGKRTLKY